MMGCDCGRNRAITGAVTSGITVVIEVVAILVVVMGKGEATAFTTPANGAGNCTCKLQRLGLRLQE